MLPLSLFFFSLNLNLFSARFYIMWSTVFILNTFKKTLVILLLKWLFDMFFATLKSYQDFVLQFSIIIMFYIFAQKRDVLGMFFDHPFNMNIYIFFSFYCLEHIYYWNTDASKRIIQAINSLKFIILFFLHMIFIYENLIFKYYCHFYADTLIHEKSH